MTFTQIMNKRKLAQKVEELMDRSEYPSTAVISAMCLVINQLCDALIDTKNELHERNYRP